MPTNITHTKELANRYGLNLKIWASGTTSFSGTGENAPEPLMTIEFVNLSNISISGDKVWATGGQAHRNKVGFDNPLTGTLKVSTQLLTAQLLALMAGKDLDAFGTATTVDFETTANSVSKDYVITADTIWKDEDGNLYDEALTAWKACPKRALNIEHNGDGDPVSVDVEFDLVENSAGKILTIGLADHV